MGSVYRSPGRSLCIAVAQGKNIILRCNGGSLKKWIVVGYPGILPGITITLRIQAQHFPFHDIYILGILRAGGIEELPRPHISHCIIQPVLCMGRISTRFNHRTENQPS